MKKSPARAPLTAARVLSALGLTVLCFSAVACGSIDGQSFGAGNSVALPPEFEPWIVSAAAQCPSAEITPALLAAQLATESGFRTDAVSPRDAQGPAQFIPETWAIWGVDADGDGVADPNNIADAVTSQARLMCDHHQRAVDGVSSGRLQGDPVDLALAAYNAGFGAVERFGGMPRGGEYSSETQPYVERIRAREADYPWLM